MTNVAPVQIVGLGASTPVGRTVWASAAAARARIAGFSEHPFMVDTSGEPLRVASAPWLDATLGMAERCCDLLIPAIDEALAAIRHEGADEAKLALALALPPPRPGRPPELARLIADALSKRYGKQFPKIVPFEFGHAAGHAALDAAGRDLTASSADACLVAGVELYIAPETLEWLEETEQLHGGGRMPNPWGFIPGEAAGAMVVTTGRFAEQHGLTTLGEVVSVGFGHETNLIKSGAVCTGEGLTAAFRAALARLAPEEKIHNTFCDLNGETYRADEFGFAALRTKERFRAATDFVAPADVWGDIGAAGVPLHVSLAVISHRKNYGKGPLSLVWASSETGERAAVVIRAADPLRNAA